MARPAVAADPQRDVLHAYENLFGPRNSDGQLVLADLTLLTKNEKDPLVRAGRADVLLHIFRAVQRSKDIPIEEVEL